MWYYIRKRSKFKGFATWTCTVLDTFFPNMKSIFVKFPELRDFFARAAVRSDRDQISGQVRGVAQRHDKQLVDWVQVGSSEQFKRSIFGIAQCFNALPQFIVDKCQYAASRKISNRASRTETGKCKSTTSFLFRFHAFFNWSIRSEMARVILFFEFEFSQR